MKRLLLWALAAHWGMTAAAQVTTREIRVAITGLSAERCRQFLDQPRIVVYGRENEAVPLRRDATDPCQWRGQATRSFAVENAWFSLRLGGARSECTSGAAKREGDADYALVTYALFVRPAQKVSVDAGASAPVSYVRRVRGKKSCHESGRYQGDPIADVDFAMEVLDLHLGSEAPDKKRSGLILDPPPNQSKPSETWKVFDRTAVRSGNTWALTPARASAVYAQQQSVLRLGQRSEIPRLPASNADALRKRLEQLQVKSIRITME